MATRLRHRLSLVLEQWAEIDWAPSGAPDELPTNSRPLSLDSRAGLTTRFLSRSSLSRHHGMIALASDLAAGAIRGRTVTTVAKCALDAEQGGATYVDQPCVVDGNLVSARTWHDSSAFMKAFLGLLRSPSELSQASGRSA
jgi:hypothetical protein